ncbi:MaoC family dehydratase [Caballeronia sordidicola]|uniref:Nodulation protein N n=1 Tax=Caballeronia sordidicola TaxID=196367 RepID=A0A242N5T7_CABSO|nr:MaoC family dehydratase [Caballeronia sordidicola]OTP79030.1 Nodulation protein N [Caballeronia sordidicola]
MTLAATTTIGEMYRSDWLTVDQSMIDRFADTTLDRQFIHVDPDRAAATPFGGTVAHGFLTLSLLPHLLEQAGQALPLGATMLVNYGLDRLRFVHPVRSGDRVRAAFELISQFEKAPGRFQQTRAVTVEIEGAAKPALTAVWLSQLLI